MPFKSKADHSTNKLLEVSSSSHLSIPNTRPRFPLSSPVSEDSAERRHMPRDNNTDSENTPENPFADSDGGDTSGYDEFRLEKYSNEARRESEGHSVGSAKSARENSKRSRGSNTKKKTRPGLNVVTNFGKSSRRVHTDDPRNEHLNTDRPPLQERAASAPKVIEIKPDFLANIAANPSRIIYNRDQTRKDDNAKKGDKAHPGAPSQSESRWPSHIRNPTLESLKRSDTKTTDVSPSARTVMIGIEEHDLDSAAREAGDTPKSITPITPSILITPAYEEDDWRTVSPENEKHSFRRPTSSIYSQATAHATFDRPPLSNAPPVPQLPDKTSKVTASVTNGPNGRSTELGNEAEEEDQAEALRPRASSDGITRGMLRRSIDSFVARPQSKGWWNLGLSPMLSRAGTTTSQKNPFQDDEAPPVPAISSSHANISKGLGLQEKDWESEFSPQTPRRNGTDSGRASTWSTWSDWENMRDGPDLSTLRAHEATKAAQQSKSPDLLLSTSPVIGGLAAEYFHASAHDLISPAPYFECQNHDCAAKLPKLESIHDISFSNNAKSLQTETSGQNGTSMGSARGEADLNSKDTTNGSRNVQTEVDSHSRSGSDSTFIEEEPSPSPTERNIEEAEKRAPKASDMVNAPDPEQPRSLGSPPATSKVEPPKKPLPYPVDTSTPAPTPAPPAPAAAAAPAPPISPPPITPAYERSTGNASAFPMSQIQHTETPPAQRPRQAILMPTPRAPFIRENSYDGPQQSTLTTRPPANAAPLPSPAFFAQNDHNETIGPSTRGNSSEEERKPPSPASSTQPFARFGRNRKEEQNEKKKTSENKPGIFSRIKSLLPKKRATEQSKRKKRLMYIIIAGVLFAIVLTILLLALLLTRGGDRTPVETQWLNLTGYPPIPTGIATVARPDLTNENSECVFPKTMWSCSLPKEQQDSVAPNDANQPNFRLEIRFKNGTVSNGTAVAQRRDPFTNDLFTPNPSPPSLAEQSFLGNTTDNTTAPFEGEATPFFISLLDPGKLPDPSSKSSRKRFADPDPNPQSKSASATSSSASSSSSSALSSKSSSSPSSSSSSSPSSSSSSLPTLPTALPPASSLSLPNGTAQPATLLPLPISQPLRLFDRGLPTEHYGFYTYFSRSIFLASDAPLNATTEGEGDVPADENGGSTRDGAHVRCTWAETRFLIRIWTNAAGAELLGGGAGNATQAKDKEKEKDKPSSANNFMPPGSFPYPITISLDRHGGNPEEKLLFCYGVDERGKIVGEGKVQEEFRGNGGQLVNPVPGLFDLGNSTSGDSDGFGNGGGFDIHAGGVDGGTGGCGCEWRNFQGGPK